MLFLSASPFNINAGTSILPQKRFIILQEEFVNQYIILVVTCVHSISNWYRHGRGTRPAFLFLIAASDFPRRHMPTIGYDLQAATTEGASITYNSQSTYQHRLENTQPQYSRLPHQKYTACYKDHSTPVKLDSRETPPPLHFSPATSDIERTSTAETTPIGTPKGFDAVYRRKSEKEKEKDLLFSWCRKPSGSFAGGASSYVDSTLLEADFEDSTFPLFTDTPGVRDMAGRSSPINIATPSRNGSASPRHHQASNLTSALHATTGNETRPTPAVDIGGGNAKGFGGGFRQREFANGAMSTLGSQMESGAQSMSMDTSNWEQPRRESLAGSLVQGMSWGGVSVGSWIRDE